MEREAQPELPEAELQVHIADAHLRRYRVFDFVCWPDAYDFVAKHQPGASITIAYDPADPAISIVPAAIRDPATDSRLFRFDRKSG